MSISIIKAMRSLDTLVLGSGIDFMVNQNNLMFGMLTPVPGILTDPLTPLGLALSVSWNGPSLIALVSDLTPCSVMFTP
jgi:hypothetical protein